MIGKDSHEETQCWRCHTTYLLPRALYVAAKASEKISFFCPYGHEAHYPASESEEAKLRRERDRLKQREAQLNDYIAAQRKEIDAQTKLVANLKKQRTATVKRSAAGLCPCCNRTFRQMALHMKNKHPEFKAEMIDASITKNNPRVIGAS